jgi:hypothetical protein
LDKDTSKSLRNCDFIFGCTDDHTGRSILTRFPYWYYIPVIDMGVFIDSSSSDIAAWVGGWSVYRDLQKEIAATSESNATAIKTETDQLNALYKSLINTTAGTEGRKKAIEDLQAKYGDTINLQNLENAGLGEIAKSQQKANQEITAALRLLLAQQGQIHFVMQGDLCQ